MKNFQKKYFRRARMASLFLSIVPFVRMVALTGSLASDEATRNSDIDFFIISKPGRIWTCRLLVTGMVQILGLRRYGKKIAGRICLNCYQTTGHLTVGPKTIKNAKDYANIKILFATDNITRKFFKANQWIVKKGFKFKSPVKKRPDYSKAIRWLGEALFEIFFNNWAEQKIRTNQIRRILNDPRTRDSKAGQIFISDFELRFHPEKSKN